MPALLCAQERAARTKRRAGISLGRLFNDAYPFKKGVDPSPWNSPAAQGRWAFPSQKHAESRLAKALLPRTGTQDHTSWMTYVEPGESRSNGLTARPGGNPQSDRTGPVAGPRSKKSRDLRVESKIIHLRGGPSLLLESLVLLLYGSKLRLFSSDLFVHTGHTCGDLFQAGMGNLAFPIKCERLCAKRPYQLL